ncbi:unnamed protein product [Brassica oleracea var. botrytis]
MHIRIWLVSNFCTPSGAFTIRHHLRRLCNTPSFRF